MDNTNNKNVFSLKLFWQTVIQLKVIGFISLAVVAFVSGFPIIIEGLNIKKMINAANAAAESGAEVINMSSTYTSLVSPISSQGVLLIVVLVITPILALYAWSFLNKRSTSDFYHSLPYKRKALFISKFAAVTFWQAVSMLTAFVASFIGYHIFRNYFIVDYGVTIHIYVAEFICALLCSAAIALACSITGNIFSNICVSGLIVFLPRFIILLIASTVTGSVATATMECPVWILDNSYNMLTAQVFGAFEPLYITPSSVPQMLLSIASNIYTLVLAVIYIVLGCVLFTKRKSETAGKPALGWKLQFAIRTAIGFVISVLGVMLYIREKRGGYRGYFLEYIVVSFVVAAFVVIIYEVISSRKLHRIIKAMPSIILAYVLAAVFGVIVNAGIGQMLSYVPDTSKVKYVKMSIVNDNMLSYSYSEEKDYFEDILGRLKITDEEVIKLVADSIEDNLQNIQDISAGYYNNGRKNEEYIKYNVYIKDGIFGRYRKVFIKQSEVVKLASKFENMQDISKEYKNLPAFEDAKLSFMDSIFTQEAAKEVYETFINEINSIPFTQYYSCINDISSRYRGGMPYIYISFTRNGIPYSAQILLGDKLPKTLNAYYNAVNKVASQNISETSNKLKKYLDNFESKRLNKSDNDDDFTLYIYSIKDGDYYYMDSSNISDMTLISEIRKALDNPFDKTFDTDKVILSVSYYDEDTYNNVKYYMQLSDYSTLKSLGY